MPCSKVLSLYLGALSANSARLAPGYKFPDNYSAA